MDPQTALARTVEDEKVPLMLRYRALQELEQPSLSLLRRLLVPSANRKTIPAKLRALASLKYAAAIRAQNARRERRLLEKKDNPLTSPPATKRNIPNALGI